MLLVSKNIIRRLPSILISVLLLILLIVFKSPANAKTILNPDIRLEQDNINPYTKESKNMNSQTDSPKKNEPIEHFVLSISNTLINYGEILAANPILRTNFVSVFNPNPNGFLITVSQDSKLYDKQSNSAIPNTTCDSGTCSDTVSGIWDNPLTYGLGFRCDDITNTKSCNGFTNTNYFKQFPDISNQHKPRTLLEGSGVDQIKSQITYKVNVSSSQALGSYSNTITFIAIPDF